MSSSLGHLPDQGARWAFDEKVTECFEDMLARSIPQYAEMRRLVLEVGSRFIRRGADIVDLGCSRGDAIATFVKHERAYEVRSFVGVEISGPMAEAFHEKFKGLEPKVYLEQIDLRKQYPTAAVPSLVLSVLTLQFTPIEYRQRIIQNVFDSLLPGGAFIVVEKVLGETAQIDALLVDEYLRKKAASGYTQEEIDRKRLALEGVLVPVTATWNQDLLTRAGFAEVDCFWRWCNFAAWVAIKKA